MAGSAMEGVRDGMEVLTSDGTSLGRIRTIYHGTVPTAAFEQCDDETTPEAHRGGLLGKGVTMYVPCRAVEGAQGGTVRLNVGMETASAKGLGPQASWVGA